MGDFRVVVEASGGHGCNRTAKAGQEAPGCGSETCPDCITARYIAALKLAGIHPKVALYTHWPAVMAEHILFAQRDGTLWCGRCDQTFANPTDALAPQPNCSSIQCKNGIGYPADREVVDDLTERKAKYPSVLRAIPLRVKGAF